MSLSWLFRQTQQTRGRRRWIDEKNTGLQFLRYGRIVLEGGEEPIFWKQVGRRSGLSVFGGREKWKSTGGITE